MPDLTHIIPTTDRERDRRDQVMLTAAKVWVGNRLAGACSNGRYADFREGARAPREVACESDEGLSEVLAYIQKVGPSLKTSDWSGSGWKGKGKRTKKR